MLQVLIFPKEIMQSISSYSSPRMTDKPFKLVIFSRQTRILNSESTLLVETMQ
jgi:hypothetical protein